MQLDSSSVSSSFSRERGLVLHGGGSAGNAWEIGVIAGLADAGLDVTAADLIVGTSAGATAAVQITHASPAALLADILSEAPRRLPGGPGDARGPLRPTIDHLARTDGIIAASTDAGHMHRRMGAGALELDAADGSWSARWRAVTEARIAGAEWPQQRILITALDARTGDGVVFDRDSGVELLDAVAASTSSGDPYRIGEDRYIDGGYRRNENADLAAGFARVVVLSPFSGRTRHPLAWGMQLSAQVEELRAAGSSVETVFPDAESLAAFGPTMVDPRTRPASARAGFGQGRLTVERLGPFWR
jgi:NTE family protein